MLHCIKEAARLCKDVRTNKLPISWLYKNCLFFTESSLFLFFDVILYSCYFLNNYLNVMNNNQFNYIFYAFTLPEWSKISTKITISLLEVFYWAVFGQKKQAKVKYIWIPLQQIEEIWNYVHYRPHGHKLLSTSR